jgi:hypothetical protein
MRFSAVLICVLSAALLSCSAVRPISESRTPGYLHFDVEPQGAEVFIDDDFKGQVDGWRGQTIPVRPGPRRIELRAKGYMSQRFDIEIGPGEQVTLKLRLEREFDELDLKPDEPER